ncbi:MAG: 3-dehydroquinate synthase [Planctomycetaceae bacterium]|nr:3-dehydroquinate synthase [Planctomycetaceae bacterium]
MSHQAPNASTDVDFHVRFRHRLRFTHDVLNGDSGVLADLLEPSEDRIPRVQFWVDEYVAEANPDLKHRLHAFARRYQNRFQVIGNPQFVPGGEAVKNDVHILERMLKVMNEADLDRRSYVVVIGGGAVLDAVGFATAIAHRGLRLVRIPTTTLAQADSGVGVKNGVNLFQKKNWLGSFAVPWGVVNDRRMLETLSDRDFRCGFSEAVKVSLLKDPAFFERIYRDASAIAQRGSECWQVIEDSALWHLKHITAGGDPFEMLEARPLDYGHWSAHKLEAMTQFELRHGEAVAIGVAVDTVYSSLVHGLPESDADRVLQTLERLGLLINHPALMQTEELFQGLEEFRQHLGGRLTVTMLSAIGKPLDIHEVDRPRMKEAIQRVVERVISRPSKSGNPPVASH